MYHPAAVRLVLYTQVLLKELEEFAFKGIPDVRGCTVQDAQLLEEVVGLATYLRHLSWIHCHSWGSVIIRAPVLLIVL